MPAGLTFLSWVRTGLISAVGPAPGTSANALDGSLPASLSLPVSLGVTGLDPTTYQAKMVGPGDVIGLDPDQIIRTDPAPGASEVETNMLASIEFDRPADLPWMLTPTSAARAATTDTDARRGLRPWICLIVIPDRTMAPPTALIPLPRVQVSDSELPDLDSSWLWAHAQVLTAAGDDLQALLQNRPERTLSRLIAPRRLRPGVTYIACVVPAFEAGRRAGIGQKPAETGPLAPAWTHGTEPRDLELPVYYSWRFTTSKTTGDFEQLARRMKAMRFGDSGVRPLDIGGAGSGLPGPATGVLPWHVQLEGVIVGDAIVPGTWTGPSQAVMPAAMVVRLAASDQELAPPTYGSLQARYPGSLSGTQGPRWLRDLNLDPRYRTTAALGTRIVQRHQEALVASAWDQTAQMREANRLLRQAQLARAVGEVIETRLTDPARVDGARLLQLTDAIHHQVRATGGASVATASLRNAAVHAAVSLPFRRITRPSGPVARRVSPGRLTAPVLRLGLPAADAQALRPTPRLRAIGGTLDLGQVSSGPGESLATLTVARMLTPVFSWEGVAGPPNIPFAYLSDLIFTVSAQRGEWWQQIQSAVAVARALDFDGTPQLGWQSVAPAVTSPSNLSAAVYIERGSTRGTLSAGLTTWWANRNNFSGFLRWHPGFSLSQGGTGTAPVPTNNVHGETPAGLAMAAADLPGTGRIDVVMVWADSTTVPLGPPGLSGPGTLFQVTVGLDFDPVTRTFRGGWTNTRSLGSPFSSVTAVGSRLFVLNGKQLRLIQLSASAPAAGQPQLTLTETAAIDIGGQLPEDFQGASAIAVADFGGGTGVDLLVCFVAGSGASARAGYRIAYDVRPTGAIGSWSSSQNIPVAIEGRSISVVLGPTEQATIDRRAALTTAFRAAASATQTRQERIIPVSAPPAPAPTVDGQQLAADIRAGLDQAAAVEASVMSRLSLAAPIADATVRDPLQPLALTPRFRFPTFELLRAEFPDRVYPGASEIPDNCVTVLVPNRKAIESFLVGLNHEMSRELLWRGFPVRHGTFFSEFWDAAREEILPVEGWDTAGVLGAHGPTAAAQHTLLLVVRAELLRRIPRVAIYAAPAKPGAGGMGRTVDLDPAQRRDPLFTGSLDPDIRFFAFNLTAVTARGVGSSDGWYFVFQQHPTSPRFGLDEADTGFGTRPADWSDIAWSHVVTTQQEAAAIVHLDAGRTSPLAGVTLGDGGSSTLQHKWGFSAAHMAHITLQRPVQIAIHGSDLIDPAVTA